MIRVYILLSIHFDTVFCHDITYIYYDNFVLHSNFLFVLIYWSYNNDDDENDGTDYNDKKFDKKHKIQQNTLR